MRQVTSFVTDLGDFTLLAPASALLLIYLLYLKSVGTAKIWLSAVALCVILTIALKLCFMTCGAQVPGLDMQSPSGHTSMSVTFYGCCALMVAGEKERSGRFALLAVAFMLVTAIAVSRLILHTHTASEVLAGSAIGAICVGWFGIRYLALPRPSLPWQPIMVAMLVLGFALHGIHWNIESLLRNAAQLFQINIQICA